MLEWLQRIWCAVTNVAWWIADLLVMILNTVLSVLALIAMTALGLFPDLPGLPSAIDNAVLQWANWLFPIGALLGIFGVYLALYVLARGYMSAVRLLDRLGISRRGS